MWVPYLHHLSTHFPIVMSLLLAIVGWWYVRQPHQILLTLLRWGGWTTVVLTTAAVVSGLLAVPDGWVSDGTDELAHHRNLGVLLWLVMTLAAVVFEIGVAQGQQAVRKLGALLWSVCFVGVLGAGHWGGSMMHSDRIPWQGAAPKLGYHVDIAKESDAGAAPRSNTNGKRSVQTGR
jgi:hypothetical protein